MAMRSSIYVFCSGAGVKAKTFWKVNMSHFRRSICRLSLFSVHALINCVSQRFPLVFSYTLFSVWGRTKFSVASRFRKMSVRRRHAYLLSFLNLKFNANKNGYALGTKNWTT